MKAHKQHRFVALLALLLCIGACAGSKGAMRDAQSTTYRAEKDSIYQIAKAEVLEKYGQLAIDDPNKGYMQSDLVWYTKEGARKSRQQGLPNPGDHAYRVSVQLLPLSEKKFKLVVQGVGYGYEQGSPVAVEYRADDLMRPYWIDGRSESLHLSIHQALKASPEVHAIVESAISKGM